MCGVESGGVEWSVVGVVGVVGGRRILSLSRIANSWDSCRTYLPQKRAARARMMEDSVRIPEIRGLDYNDRRQAFVDRHSEPVLTKVTMIDRTPTPTPIILEKHFNIQRITLKV